MFVICGLNEEETDLDGPEHICVDELSNEFVLIASVLLPPLTCGELVDSMNRDIDRREEKSVDVDQVCETSTTCSHAMSLAYMFLYGPSLHDFFVFRQRRVASNLIFFCSSTSSVCPFHASYFTLLFVISYIA